MPGDVLPELAIGSVDLFRRVLDRSEVANMQPKDPQSARPATGCWA